MGVSAHRGQAKAFTVTFLSPRAGEGPLGVPTFITLGPMCCNCQGFAAWVLCLYMSPVPRQGLGSYLSKDEASGEGKGWGALLAGELQTGETLSS